MSVSDLSLEPYQNKEVTFLNGNNAPLNPLDAKVDNLSEQIFQNGTPNRPLPAIQQLAAFVPLTQEQVEAMNIQELVEALLLSCFLLNHRTQTLVSKFLHTLQNNIDLIVAKLSAHQGLAFSSVPDFIAITANGLAGFIAPAKTVLEAFGGTAKTVGDIWKQTDRSQETPLTAALTQAQATIQAYREKNPQLSNKEEETLQKLERAINAALELCMRIFN